MGVLTRDRGGGGANRNFQAFKVMFFPFVQNSRPGGGGVLSKSLDPFGRFFQYFMGVLQLG